jgi:guanylate kinase
MAEPRIIVLTAPSGAGKSTIAERVLAAMPQARFSVSATTRAPRPGEEDGVDYHFLAEEEFRRAITEGEMLEYEEVYEGRFYGTLRSEIDRATRDRPVLLVLDVKGAAHVEELFGDEALTLFINPPSLGVLEDRLRERNTETTDTLRERLDRARMEMDYADECDATVVNDDLDDAVEETLARIHRFLEIDPSEINEKGVS